MSLLTPHSPYPQLCQDEQQPSKEPPSLTAVNISSVTVPSVHDFPSVSPPSPSHDLNQPLNITLEPCLPQTHENHLNEALVTSNHTNNSITPQHFCSLIPAHTGKTREAVDLKNDSKAVEVDELITGKDWWLPLLSLN